MPNNEPIIVNNVKHEVKKASGEFLNDIYPAFEDFVVKVAKEAAFSLFVSIRQKMGI